jgi:phenylpropionate dioxygenase-like ring-hydroxylating dioxygenase large terminal subunit
VVRIGAPASAPATAICRNTRRTEACSDAILQSVIASAEKVCSFPVSNPKTSPDARYKTALCGPYGVNTSAPRIVENFLDMAHLPYVHTGILGQEPHTEVKDYNVRRGSDGEGPIATNCMFWQPSPTLTDQASSYVNYTYRVPRPCTAILTKQPESAGSSGLSIMLTVTPVEQERSTAWILYSVANTTKTEAELRARQELVFLQDKGIVENQLPKRLPLDPNAERAFACDRLSVAYRRYLKEQGIRFGVSVSAS